MLQAALKSLNVGNAKNMPKMFSVGMAWNSHGVCESSLKIKSIQQRRNNGQWILVI